MWHYILSEECGDKPVTEVNLTFDEKAVQYQWLKASRETWRLAPDPIESACQFVTEHGQENMIGLLNVEAAPGTTVLAFEVTDFVNA
jgi:hypothetical protein